MKRSAGTRLQRFARHIPGGVLHQGRLCEVPAGTTVNRKGKPLLIKIKGAVEAFYR